MWGDEQKLFFQNQHPKITQEQLLQLLHFSPQNGCTTPHPPCCPWHTEQTETCTESESSYCECLVALVLILGFRPAIWPAVHMLIYKLICTLLQYLDCCWIFTRSSHSPFPMWVSMCAGKVINILLPCCCCCCIICHSSMCYLYVMVFVSRAQSYNCWTW